MQKIGKVSTIHVRTVNTASTALVVSKGLLIQTLYNDFKTD